MIQQLPLATSPFKSDLPTLHYLWHYRGASTFNTKKIYSLSFSCRSQAPWTWHGRSVTVLPYRETWLHAFLAFSGSFLDPSRSTSRSRHVLVGGRKTANGSIRWRLCFLRPHRERTNNPVAFLFPLTPRLGVWPLLYHVSSG